MKNKGSRIQISTFLLLCFVFLASGCNNSGFSDKEASFLSEVDMKLDSQIILQTDKPQYNGGEILAYYVNNRRTQPIYFVDQSMGICAYKYDPSYHKWIKVPLNFTVSDPQPKTIYRDGNPINASYILDTSDISANGMIRLAISGWKDSNNPNDSKFVAFTDIEITPIK